VLGALSSSFGLTYKLPPKIDRLVSGQYSGSLSKVLVRILDGSDYIIRNAGNQIEIDVLGISTKASAASGSQSVGTSDSQPKAVAQPGAQPLAPPRAATPSVASENQASPDNKLAGVPQPAPPPLRSYLPENN
jgi:hypothetical protein